MEVISYHEVIFWQRAQTPNGWTELFCTMLIDQIGDPETYGLLRLLNGSTKYNNEIASFLFPYVLLHSLTWFNSRKRKELDKAIKREFDFIFKVIRDEKHFKRVQHLEEFKYKFLAAEHFNKKKHTKGIKRSKIVQLPNESFFNAAKQIAKLIFEAMDFLTRYQCKEEENERIKSLLNKFNFKTLAKVSYNCGDYQRALILYESYLKSLKESDHEEEWVFLVHIYAKLGDNDSITGVADKKKYPFSGNYYFLF